MKSPQIIYADGVVTTSNSDDAVVLSSRESDSVLKRDVNLSAFRSVWGHWYPDSYREIRLNLHIAGEDVLEGDTDHEPEFLEFARRIAKRQGSLSGDIGIFLFSFSAAHVHLRSLLREYARLTSVIGPKIPFDHSPVCSIDYPECYAHFDSCLASLRSFADSTRFLVWRLLARGKGVPRNLRTLAGADLPDKLAHVVRRYLDSSIEDLSEYRDNAIHYAPPGAHMSPWLLLSKNVIHAQVWLPENPGARSLKRFKYGQKDAYRYAKSLLEQSYEFCNELFPILDDLHRRRLRERKKR